LAGARGRAPRRAANRPTPGMTDYKHALSFVGEGVSSFQKIKSPLIWTRMPFKEKLPGDTRFRVEYGPSTAQTAARPRRRE
jgi:hypothetical protein